jgi:hypothetical protein
MGGDGMWKYTIGCSVFYGGKSTPFNVRKSKHCPKETWSGFHKVARFLKKPRTKACVKGAALAAGAERLPEPVRLLAKRSPWTFLGAALTGCAEW